MASLLSNNSPLLTEPCYLMTSLWIPQQINTIKEYFLNHPQQFGMTQPEYKSFLFHRLKDVPEFLGQQVCVHGPALLPLTPQEESILFPPVIMKEIIEYIKTQCREPPYAAVPQIGKLSSLTSIPENWHLCTNTCFEIVRENREILDFPIAAEAIQRSLLHMGIDYPEGRYYYNLFFPSPHDSKRKEEHDDDEIDRKRR